jgi:pilus assembly protein CpaD
MKLKPSSIGVCLLLFTILPACTPKNNGLRDNGGLDTIYKASVTLNEFAHTVHFSSGKLTDKEQSSLATFIAASGLRYGDKFNLRTSEPDMSIAYRNAINIVLARFGVTLGSIETIIGLEAGSAALVVVRATAILPKCGIQSGPNGANIKNENMANYGCATRSNLAAMVANPADLISGNTLDGQGADITAKPVDGYGGHELTGIKSEGTKKNWTPQGPEPK